MNTSYSFSRITKFAGKVGAPEGNGNACKSGQYGKNCGGSGMIGTTPKRLVNNAPKTDAPKPKYQKRDVQEESPVLSRNESAKLTRKKYDDNASDAEKLDAGKRQQENYINETKNHVRKLQQSINYEVDYLEKNPDLSPENRKQSESNISRDEYNLDFYTKKIGELEDDLKKGNFSSHKSYKFNCGSKCNIMPEKMEKKRKAYLFTCKKKDDFAGVGAPEGNSNACKSGAGEGKNCGGAGLPKGGKPDNAVWVTKTGKASDAEYQGYIPNKTPQKPRTKEQKAQTKKIKEIHKEAREKAKDPEYRAKMLKMTNDMRVKMGMKPITEDEMKFQSYSFKFAGVGAPEGNANACKTGEYGENCGTGGGAGGYNAAKAKIKKWDADNPQPPYPFDGNKKDKKAWNDVNDEWLILRANSLNKERDLVGEYEAEQYRIEQEKDEAEYEAREKARNTPEAKAAEAKHRAEMDKSFEKDNARDEAMGMGRDMNEKKTKALDLQAKMNAATSPEEKQKYKDDFNKAADTYNELVRKYNELITKATS